MTGQPRVALITGAGSGIGRAVALKLQGAGYDVALVGRRVAELETTAGQAKAGGGRFLVAPADVTNEAAVKTAFDKTRESFGRLDVLFNNAGTFAQGVTGPPRAPRRHVATSTHVPNSGTHSACRGDTPTADTATHLRT